MWLLGVICSGTSTGAALRVVCAPVPRGSPSSFLVPFGEGCSREKSQCPWAGPPAPAVRQLAPAAPECPSSVLRARAARPVCGTPRRGLGGAVPGKPPSSCSCRVSWPPGERPVRAVRGRRAPAVPRWGFGARSWAGPEPYLWSGAVGPGLGLLARLCFCPVRSSATAQRGGPARAELSVRQQLRVVKPRTPGQLAQRRARNCFSQESWLLWAGNGVESPQAAVTGPLQRGPHQGLLAERATGDAAPGHRNRQLACPCLGKPLLTDHVSQPASTERDLTQPGSLHAGPPRRGL
ncbi:uncharacterized protein LOC116587117 [Mustela erminea]|uniref:uncharacterized protein LOC116587117 n=1 Tax=Mustela erminea TaxID=36723 RepID=UPI00138736D2|nr:uncharacterized protein LOC116587117 [Mustela erminea]